MLARAAEIAPTSTHSSLSRSSFGTVDDHAALGLLRQRGHLRRARRRRQRLARAEQPVGREHLLDLRDDRPAQAEVHVDHLRRAHAGHRDVLVADVHATRESQLAVDREDLAVVAQVQGEVRRPQPRLQEPRNLHAGAAKTPPHARQRVELAEAVEQYAHLDAARARRAQRLDELRADAARIEDVGRQIDMATRLADREQHRGIGVLAAVQRLDAVARQQLVAAGREAEIREVAVLRRDQVLGGNVLSRQRRRRLLILAAARAGAARGCGSGCCPAPGMPAPRPRGRTRTG